MLRHLTRAIVIACAALPLVAETPASASDVLKQETATSAAEEVSAQSRTQVRQRARTRIRVYPLYPHRNFHTIYPPPYDIEYPGPNAVRHCVANLVPEYRPSGTVIVPRTRCWWARG